MPTLEQAAGNLIATLIFNELMMQRVDLYLQLAFIPAWGIVVLSCMISLDSKKPELRQTDRGQH